MPKRLDIKSILIIGAGPIVIGQACEFDYSGTQACQALREEGYRVILVNSNPATIMTDPDAIDLKLADATYIEPLHWQTVARIIAKERPDAILPTVGGQTGLNCALSLAKHGVLEEYGVQLLGASREAIDKAEDRLQFRDAMVKIGLNVPQSALAHNLTQAQEVLAKIGFPAVIRPSFTLGGSGGGIAYNREEFIEICQRGLELSPTSELLIEESILGWKEFELEVVRDRADNCIVVCSIENLDPMGVHTGDSITVAPAQTLTDKEYQMMRNAAFAVLREIGVETGGANVQFAVNPQNGQLIVVEMNPRVSRSSALASKATGFPIAKIAAKLAVGYTLDELQNEITGNRTPASFEPTIDYVVTKIPRFNFDRFPHADKHLTTQMKAVGEVMAIGRTFQESLQKAIRSLEIGVFGLQTKITDFSNAQLEKIERELREPSWDRLWYVADAFRAGYSVQKIADITKIDPWFLIQIQELVQIEDQLCQTDWVTLGKQDWYCLKQKGFADRRLAQLWQIDELQVRQRRWDLGVRPVYKRVDTCAAEFPTATAYQYSCYEQENECNPKTAKKIMILGSGPNRIGQGIEFDCCCVHGALAARSAGYLTIMVNCNPETVSTDFNVADILYFEPLTAEDILEIVAQENPQGVIVQFGGQTPLNLSKALQVAGVPIIGTQPDAIDCAESRERFSQLLKTLGLNQPPNQTAHDATQALALAQKLQYPLIVRPSYVLGGQAMEIVYHEAALKNYLERISGISATSPLLLDQFLVNAIEVDVDAICDGETVFIGGILEHIEEAGIHSGDSTASFPPFSLPESMQQTLIDQVTRMALALNVVGLINVQFAICDQCIYVLEVNPRASRTVPFIAKAIGVPLAKIAAKCMLGISLAEQGYTQAWTPPHYYAVKKPCFPFIKFPEEDSVLGPEMRSTGEVMGIAKTFGEAFAKSQLGAGIQIPTLGKAFFSVRDEDKPRAVKVAERLHQLGFQLIATRGTADVLLAAGIPCSIVNKVREGRPHIVDMIKNDEISFILNTTAGANAVADARAIRRSYSIRLSAIQRQVWYSTTVAGAEAACSALEQTTASPLFSLQELHCTVPIKTTAEGSVT